MFRILNKSLRTGIVTVDFPRSPAVMSERFRGAPRFEFDRWRDARPAAEVCPTGAISIRESGNTRYVTVDYGLCTYCGECAATNVDGGIQATRQFEPAARDRRALIQEAEYELNTDGSHHALKHVERRDLDLESKLTARIGEVLGRSLAIREVDAGSCNGCELEIGALNNPIYDLERLGIHFVASPRHADMLLVTGPVTRNMELALMKTYQAMAEPKVVVAVGACGISGGIFGTNYATVGGVDQVVPVDVYIPGCPPHPYALLQGILLAVGRLA